ncbi:MAG: hypothetical protein ACTS7E_04140 [Arsenophonus sp. NC-CH8-MAG3]
MQGKQAISAFADIYRVEFMAYHLFVVKIIHEINQQEYHATILEILYIRDEHNF